MKRRKMQLAEKKWPYYYPSGERVPFNVRMNYFKELKAQKSRSRVRAPGGSPQDKAPAGGRHMARRKSRRRTVVRTVKRYRKSGSAGSFNFQKMLMPTLAASIGEPFLDNVAKQLPIPTVMGIEPDDALKVALAWYFKNKGGMAGNTIKLMGIFGLRNIASQLIGKYLGTGTNQTDVFASQGF